jgi:tetratricopeptide (TPR) repeat protein
MGGMDEHDRRGFYRILEASPNTPFADLKRHYRRLALRYHPDLEQDPGRRCEQQVLMQDLNEAWDHLRDSELRTQYDGECGFQRCIRHPLKFVDGACSRCGIHLCPECVPAGGTGGCCQACRERSERRRRTRDPVERALLAIEDGEFAAAHIALAEALVANPRDVVALTALSTVHEKRGDMQSAVAALKMALRLKPDHAFSHFRLGMLHQRLGDVPNARMAYSEALRLNPGNAKYLGALSTLKAAETNNSERKFHIHDRVAHQVFGSGVVSEVTQVGIKVVFGDGGARWLDPARSPMVRQSG